jgi:hypothetical protein
MPESYYNRTEAPISKAATRGQTLLERDRKASTRAAGPNPVEPTPMPMPAPAMPGALGGINPVQLMNIINGLNPGQQMPIPGQPMLGPPPVPASMPPTASAGPPPMPMGMPMAMPPAPPMAPPMMGGGMPAPPMAPPAPPMGQPAAAIAAGGPQSPSAFQQMLKYIFQGPGR